MQKRNSNTNCDVLLIGYEELENLGLRSIAAYLIQNGVKVKIESCDKRTKDDLLFVIKKENPKIVGFSLIFQRMLFDFADLISYLRYNGITAHITMGGHFPSIEFNGTMDTIPCLDSIIRGEGEETLLELFYNLYQPDNWGQIKGLVYKKNGNTTVNPPRPLIRNLDNLPFPIRSNQTVTMRGLKLCSIISSRGCYFNCSFCSIHQFYSESPGPKRRSRSPSNVVNEMEQLFNERGINIFIFDDDDLSMRGHVQRQWVDDFVKEVKKRNLADNILWRISCRVDEVDEELLRTMMDEGLMCIYIGIESGNNQGLKTYNKHYTVQYIYNVINVLHKLKLPFEFGFMILNPDCTFNTLKEDIIFLKDIDKTGGTNIQFTKMVPYAGTPIAQKLKDEGKLTGTIDSPDYTFNDPRLELLQLFFTQAFHFRNFDNNGLVELLRYAKFDAILLNKFFRNKYNTQSYSNLIHDLIRKSNEVCLENMSLAVNFMEKQTEKEIFDNWYYLNNLIRGEQEAELQITNALNNLMACYS